jgi:hypothetical protein
MADVKERKAYEGKLAYLNKKGVDNMFEKEAQRSFDELDDRGIGDDWSIEESYVNGFSNGAEFGHNKANEWHYPSKGEYPKECENVLCYCKGPGIKFCCVGHTIVSGDNKVRWWANNKTEELRIIAWKEIVLPELKESK